MADHIHEWQLIGPMDRGALEAECFWRWEESGYKKQCPARLSEKEINRRLNAVDKLSAKFALRAAEDVHVTDRDGEALWVKLEAYAAALEVEDE